MRRKLLLLFMILPVFAVCTYGQGRTISGTVTDEMGDPVPGATVSVKGTNKGAAAKFDGKYTLSGISTGGVLVFTAVGFTTKEITVGASDIINASLQSESTQLTDVVVTALGIKRDEKSLGYSVQQVAGDDLTEARETNVVNSLTGKIAGVQVNGASGNLGGSSRILLRGANSITGENQPLFVVDGIPMDNSNFTSTGQARGSGGYDYGNAIQDINPDDIETISVLKGPSAAALYGTRAANGVILITTKNGSNSTKGLGISFNTGVSFETVSVLPEYQNKYGGGSGAFGTYTGNNILYPQFDGDPVADYYYDESWGPKLDGRLVRHWDSWDEWDTENFGKLRPWSPNPDNIKDFFETGVTFTNNVALSRGNEDANFRLSYSDIRQTGVMPNSELTRNTLSFNSSVKPIEKLTASVSATYVFSKATGRPGTGYDGSNVMQPFNQWSHRQMDMNRLRNYKNPDGSQRTWNRISADNSNPNYTDNPFWTRYENYQNDHRHRVFGNVLVSYQFTDYLELTGRILGDYYLDRREERIAVGSQATPMYREGTREVFERNADLMLKFNKRFADDKLSVVAFVGGNMMQRRYGRNVGTTSGGLSVPKLYNLSNSVSSPVIDDYFEKRRINSLFGSASFGYMDMLFVDVTARNDFSSTLPIENNSYFYPSVTSGFVFSEINGLKESSWLSFGKLRGGWAQVGSDADVYQLFTTFVPKENFGDNPNYAVSNSLNNENLKPERTSSWEVGTDLRFFDNRLAIDLTYYESITKDQIMPVQVSGASGSQYQIVNAGKMENKGIELMLTGTPVKLKNSFQWDISINWAKNKNKVLELLPGLDNYRIGTAPFQVSVNAKVGEEYGTILGTDFVYDANGNKLIDDDGLYLTTTSLVPIGNVMPDWTGGILNSFSYKGFTLSALIDMQKGGDIFSISNMFGKYSGMLDITAEGNIRETGLILDGVKQSDGTQNDITVSAIDFFSSFYGMDAASVYDASYVKLREVKIGYTFPDKWFGNTPFRNVTFSLVGRNLAILYKNIPHLDPESVLSSGNVQGIEGAQVPSLRSWGFNLNFAL